MSNETFIDNEIITETKNSTENFIEHKTEDESLLISEIEQDSPIKLEETGTLEIDSEKKPEWVDLLGSGAIMKKIILEGKPDTRPQRLEKCVINYSCLLEDETIVESANNFVLRLGESDVIQGLDLSIGLMNVNEKCRLRIEPRLAFGKKGLPPKVTANTPVIYDVELVSIQPEDEIDMLTIHERKSIGNKKRERGNWWYSRGENNIAIQCYRRALDYLDEVEGGISSTSDNEEKEVSDSELQSLLEDRISVCNNMAAAQIKMEMYDAALNSLQIVLRCQPNNVKAHFRKAKVYIGKNDLPTAMKCLQKAKELSPNDSEIQKEINAISRMLEKQKVSERELARRMFNPRKSDKGDVKKGTEKKKVGLWATIGLTVVIGVAGIVAYRFKYA